MARLFPPMTRYLALLLVALSLLGLTACASEEEATPETETGNPTPELAVVVFETEEPTPELPTPTATLVPEASPTPGATVGVGISGGTQSSPEAEAPPEPADAFARTRPADVNPLTGLQVDDPAVLERRPLMVRIGNDPGARPQVALNEADVIYEEIVEWWVTRFTAIYLSNDPEMIAPIRSARLINLQLVPQYQGVLANSGGSDPVRWEISQTDIVNLDEYFVPQPYFYRPNEGWQTRLALDATAARDYLSSEGLDIDVGLQGFYFREQLDRQALPAAALGPAQEVDIPYPQQTTATRWEYDSSSGKYQRFLADQPMRDFSGEQITASNVIIYFADHQPTDIVEDSNGATSIRVVVNGRGAAWLFRDGQVLKGNWEADGSQTPLFVFDDGQPMPLKPGNSWIEVVPLEYVITINGTEHSSQPGLLESLESDGDAPAESEADSPAESTPTSTPIGARPSPTPQP